MIPLHCDAREDVRIETWAPGAAVALDVRGGFEALVISVGFTEGSEAFVAQSWLRPPPGGRLDAVAVPEGARVWIKTGHIAGIA